MSEKTVKAAADFQEAWKAISQGLTAETVEERERLLTDAFFGTPMPARNAFAFALISIVADRQVSP